MQHLIPGKTYKITKFTKNIDILYKNLLINLGFIPGTKFVVKRYAVFSDTVQIKLKNSSSLSLRLKELIDVLVEPC